MNPVQPHEPQEKTLSVDDAFADARNSEARWQALETESGLNRIYLDLPKPLYQRLERLARQQKQTLPVFIERVMEVLVSTFGPAD